MKSLRFLYYCLLLSALLVSCHSGNSNLEKMLPADALGVVSINLPAIIKKADLQHDGVIKIPTEIQAVIDENDDNLLAQVLTDLPYMGVDLGSRVYLFLTNKTFSSVLLVSLDDERQARQTLVKRLGADFAAVEGLDCVYRGENAYVIHDKVLLIGTVSRAIDVNKVAKAAKNIFGHQYQSIMDDDRVSRVVRADDDLNAYFLQDGLRMLLKRSKAYRQIAQRIPLVDIFTESDIMAYVGHVNFDREKAAFTSQIIADEGSDYNQLLDSTLASADPSFLKAIPNTMDCIVAMSVDGEQFVKLKPIKQLVEMFSNLPFIGRLDLAEMLSSLDGPIAVGLARDPHLEGEWNAVIAAKTSRPEMILDRISAFATSVGQAPEIYDNEYVYQYENKMIKLGVTDGVLYLKMLDYEQTEGYAYELQAVRSTFEKCNIGLYINPQVQGGGTFCYGMTDHFNGYGEFAPQDSDVHSARALLRVLCGIKPPGAYDDMLDDEDAMDFGIEGLKPMP